MSSIPGALPRYVTVEALLPVNQSVPQQKETVVPGNLQIDTAAIAAGGLLPGTVLGRITSSGYLVPCRKTATDGSEVPYGLLHRGFDNRNGLSVGGVEPCSVVVRGYQRAEGIHESLIDPSWGSLIADRLAAIQPLLRQAGILPTKAGLYSVPGVFPAGASVPTAVDYDKNVVEIVISTSPTAPMTTVYDQHKGVLVQLSYGQHWLIDQRNAAWLVSLGAATYA